MEPALEQNPLACPPAIVDLVSNKLPDQPETRVIMARRLAKTSFPDQPEDLSHSIPTTIENVDCILRMHGIDARYNIIKKKTEIVIPGHRGTSDNRSNATMSEIVSLAALNGLSTGLVAQFVEVIADRNAFNPVADWIRSKPWDGVDRLPSFYDTVTAREGFPEDLKHILLRKWVLSAAAAALIETGFRTRGVLTLQGRQSLGKTAWCMALVSDPALRDIFIKADHHIDGANKDSLIMATRHWIVEIGELDGSLKRDIARLKGFLTNGYDKVRLPYARAESEFQRRTVFVATVNEQEFLVDNTGNTRFWTIPIEHLNYQHEVDMQQLFAQMGVSVAAGEKWWLDPVEEERVETQNLDHRTSSFVRDLIGQYLDLDPDRTAVGKLPAMSPTEMLATMGVDRPSNAQCKECAAILREHLGEAKKINGSHKWRVPLRQQGTYGVKLQVPDEY